MSIENNSKLNVENAKPISWLSFATYMILDIKNISEYLNLIIQNLDEMKMFFQNWTFSSHSKQKLVLIRKQVWVMNSMLFNSWDEKSKLFDQIKQKLKYFSNI